MSLVMFVPKTTRKCPHGFFWKVAPEWILLAYCFVEFMCGLFSFTLGAILSYRRFFISRPRIFTDREFSPCAATAHCTRSVTLPQVLWGCLLRCFRVTGPGTVIKPSYRSRNITFCFGQEPPKRFFVFARAALLAWSGDHSR